MIAKRLQQVDISKIDNPHEQIKYVRRGELLLAYVMIQNYPNVTGVSGSIFAQQHFKDDILDLAKGADIEHKPNVYWQNSSGIFGQYYIGVLSQLQLIFLPDSSHRTYRVTPKGSRLNELFRKSLPEENENEFWNAIYTGKVSKHVLESLKELALHRIENEEELNEYSNIFREPDGLDIAANPIYHRINSIKLLMEYIDTTGMTVTKRNVVLPFLRHNFENVLSQKIEATEEQVAWFLYELNELTHTAYEAFHFAILYSITDEPTPLENVLQQLEERYLECEATVNEKLYDVDENIHNCYKRKDYGALIYEASKQIKALQQTIKPYFEQLLEFAQHNNYNVQHPGFAPSLLLKLTNSYRDKEDWEFAENCIYFAINDHLNSSYSKSTIGQGIVHNYMIEDGLIWKLREPVPIRTSPRLQNVLQYIEDIKWIESDEDCYKLTSRGHKILGK